jgi:hypothetical protein
MCPLPSEWQKGLPEYFDMLVLETCARKFQDPKGTINGRIIFIRKVKTLSSIEKSICEYGKVISRPTSWGWAGVCYMIEGNVAKRLEATVATPGE